MAKESGFRFHNVLRQSTETHQDCLCSLAMSIGHTETSYEKYGPVKQLWNLSRNNEVQKSRETKKQEEVINLHQENHDACSQESAKLKPLDYSKESVASS